MEGIVTTLALLACPVGMGLMMLFMGRGMRDRRAAGEHSPDELRAEQRRIAAELERHEARAVPASGAASGPDRRL
ncbi:MAG: hypothetical protein ACRDSN_10530 [Pseudonocardiaceae bacterium]